MKKKKYKKCKYCGEPVVAPHKYDFHISCLMFESFKETYHLKK